MIAVVGTRKATGYGKRLAERFSEELSRFFVVVSGMAYGIDSSAHEGAMRGGRTVAVLASGVDVPTPRGNESLYSRILERGCVMSVYPLGSGAKKHRFPERNSLIAGLSIGVVVVEAPLKSGALITASIAADLSRDVFAVPGDVDRYTSAGTNELIKAGAIPVTSPEDVLAHYGISPTEAEPFEDEILELIRKGYRTVEEIVEATGKGVGEILSKITELELRGLVVNDSGELRFVGNR